MMRLKWQFVEILMANITTWLIFLRTIMDYHLNRTLTYSTVTSQTGIYYISNSRGSFSVEVIVTLFAWMAHDPKCMHLTRGNHEAKNMNKLYGFEGEVLHKYCR